jgi:hypothetical protein
MTEPGSSGRALEGLSRLYIPFQIVLIVLWSICLIPIVGLAYLGWFLFVPAIAFAICNLLASLKLNNAPGVQSWDIVILVMTVVSVVPVIGWFSAAIGLAFSISAFIRFRKWASNSHGA